MWRSLSVNGKRQPSLLNNPRFIGQALLVLVFLIMTASSLVIFNIYNLIGELNKEDAKLRATLDNKTRAIESSINDLRVSIAPKSTVKAIYFGGNSFLY